MIGLRELLATRGLDLSRKIKVIRHQHTGWDLYQMMVEGHLETYQKFQGGPVFNCDVIVSFIGLARTTSRLIGVYDVGEFLPARDVPMPEYPYRHEHNIATDLYYNLKRLPNVQAEMSLHVLAYNLKRVINIFGVPKLIAELQAA